MLRFRRIVFHLHCYLGLVIGLFLVVVSVTGSLIVFREEVEALIYPALMKTQFRGERKSVQQIVDKVELAFPHERIFSLRMPRTPDQTYLLKMNNPHDLFVYVDPYNGRIIGAHRQDETLMGWLTLIHTQLLSGERGKIILGIGGLLMFVMCITGFYLWYLSNNRFIRGFVISKSSTVKRLVYDVHRVFGIYIVLFLMLAGLTGIFLVFSKTTAEFINFLTASSSRPISPLSRPTAAAGSVPSVDAMLEQADVLLPGEITWVNFPQTPQSVWVVRKKLLTEWHPNGRNFIYFDQYTGTVLLVENADTAPIGTRIYNLFYPLHVGAAGGLPGRILQAAAGLLIVVLLFTGYLLWFNKKKSRVRKRIPRKFIAENSKRLLELLFRH